MFCWSKDVAESSEAFEGSERSRTPIRNAKIAQIDEQFRIEAGLSSEEASLKPIKNPLNPFHNEIENVEEGEIENNPFKNSSWKSERSVDVERVTSNLKLEISFSV